jgi:two-component system sensor histidine kinase DctS
MLVAALLGMLVWLAGRYEISQVQTALERDTGDAVSDIRGALTRNVQGLQSLYAGSPTPGSWTVEAAALLHEHREWVRLEWRDPGLAVLAQVDTPYRTPVFDRLGRENAKADVALACAAARKFNGAAYSGSYFVPLSDGLGMEVMEMCMPLVAAGRLSGYVVATYSLQDMLSELITKSYTRSQEVSFTEPDGTRLALHGTVRRGNRVFTAQQLLDLPGNTLVLRMDGWRGAPDLFPNVLTALVTAMSIALVSVLVLLGKDMRRRLKAEHDLADALAFRKAMEDSLVTGLRARDLAGRTTYVNPSFCRMVGFSADELLGRGTPAPYWPPEMAGEYQQRQAIRLAGNSPREGVESVFMRKDGSRFPVLIIEAPLINVLGKQTGWMSALLDISEQRRIEELSRASQDRLQATARLATVGEMASLLSHELNQQVRVAMQLEGGLPDALCDRTMVEQVLLNLARNAMQAMDLPGLRERELLFRVRRAASAEGNRWLEFAVVDGGPGIPDEVARQLFTPFYTTKTEGMGLGLSLCRTVVEQHGGYLDFTPRVPQGTVFRFTLPAAPDRPAGAASIE